MQQTRFPIFHMWIKNQTVEKTWNQIFRFKEAIVKVLEEKGYPQSFWNRNHLKTAVIF